MSEKFQNKYRVKSIRKINWNYSNSGAYFVTICTKGNVNYFGTIVETQSIASLRTTQIGDVAKEYWYEIPKFHPYVSLDEFILMPNHLHGIIFISSNSTPEINGGYVNKFGPQSKNLSSIIRGYKSGVKTFAVKNNITFYWQERFYERIIRDE